MYVHGESVSSVTPDQQRIPRKNKTKKTSYTSIKGKYSIQEPDHPIKRAKEDSIPNVEKRKKHFHCLKIRKTILVILIRRLVVPIILQVKLMVVRGTWAKNMKMKRMNNSVKIILRLIIVLNQKLVNV